jgi:hypothetical protein
MVGIGRPTTKQITALLPIQLCLLAGPLANINYGLAPNY